jgi:hypothetical protein
MKKFIVNVVEKKITPFVVEANDEWEAMVKAKDGEGYIHETGSVDIALEPTSWNVESLNEYPRYAFELINEYV